MSYIQKKAEARKYFKVLKNGRKLKEVASLYNVDTSYIFDLLKQYYPFMGLNEILLHDENKKASKELRSMLIAGCSVVVYGDSSVDKFSFVKNVADQLNLLLDIYTMSRLRKSAELLAKMNNSHLAPSLEIYNGKIIVLRGLKKFDWRGFKEIFFASKHPFIIITDEYDWVKDMPTQQVWEDIELKSIVFSTEYKYIHEPWTVAKSLLYETDREECHQMLKTMKGNWSRVLYYLRAGIHQITEPTLRKYNYDVACFVDKNKYNMNREFLIYYISYGLIPSHRKITWLKPYYFGKKHTPKEYKKYKQKPKKKKKPQKTLEVYL